MNKVEFEYISSKRQKNPLFHKLKVFAGQILSWDSSVQFTEMYSYQNSEGNLHSKQTDQQYLKNQFVNTRTKIKTETRLEIDKLPREKAEEIIIQTGLELQKRKIHFAVFDSGGRSPHLIIYDFLELEKMSAYKRFMAQILFWRQVMPFGTSALMDTAILHDEHLVPMEFSLHWKTQKPFDLVLEYLPHQKNYQEELKERKLRAKIYAKEREAISCKT